MIQRIRWLYLLSLLGVGSISSGLPAYAGELKVLDTRGLIRGIKEVKGSAVVVVTLTEPPKAQTVTLSNVNGLSADLSGQPDGPRTIRFEPVPEGEWKIQATPGAISVKSVEIQ